MLEAFSLPTSATVDTDGLPVNDFHQHPDRRSILDADRVPTLTIVIRDGDRVRSSALLEQDGPDWYMWRGPEGTPRPDVLALLLDTCPDDADVYLVLRPAWVDRRVLRERGWRLSASWSTRHVPVDTDEETVLAGMRSSARSRVRRAGRESTRFVVDRDLLPAFYRVYAAAMVRNGSPDFASEALLHDHLDRGHARLMIAMVGDSVAAGAVCLEHEQSLEARYVATDPAFRRSGPLHFVYFRSILWAAEHGKSTFDLSGMSTTVADDKIIGINRFKSSFGGTTFTYPIFYRPARINR